jgi:hypothetical protein
VSAHALEITIHPSSNAETLVFSFEAAACPVGDDELDAAGLPSAPSKGASAADDTPLAVVAFASSLPPPPPPSTSKIFDPPNKTICSGDTLLASLKNTWLERTISLYKNQFGNAPHSLLRFGGVR